MFAKHNPYSVARFDGALLFSNTQAGVMTTGKTKSPIVRFSVLAGIQSHPVWALDRLAVTIYAYSRVAQAMQFQGTELQVSVTATWVSSNDCSNLIATYVEWHTSPELRKMSLTVLAELENNRKGAWPVTKMTLPVQGSH